MCEAECIFSRYIYKHFTRYILDPITWKYVVGFMPMLKVWLRANWMTENGYWSSSIVDTSTTSPPSKNWKQHLLQHIKYTFLKKSDLKSSWHSEFTTTGQKQKFSELVEFHSDLCNMQFAFFCRYIFALPIFVLISFGFHFNCL